MPDVGLGITFRARDLTGPEFDQLRAELRETAKGFKNVEVIADRFSRESRDAIADLRREVREARGDFGELSLGAGVISGGLLLVGGASIKAAVEFDKLKRALAAVTGSTEEAEVQFARLQKVAEAPGLGLEEAVRGSLRLQGSLKQLGLGAEFAERSVAALGNAVARSGGGREELERAILAIAQIGAKGKLSAEEIRGQLGDAILETGAVLQNVFGTQSVDAIRDSGISVRDFLEQLIGGFEELAPVSDSASNQFENFNDAMTRAQATLGNVLLPTFTKILTVGTNVIESIANLTGTQASIVVWGGVAVAAITGIISVLAGFLAILPQVVGGVRLLSAALAVLNVSAGPVAIAITAISALALIFFGIKKNIDDARFSVEDFTKALQASNRVEIEINIGKAEREIKGLRREMGNFERDIGAVQARIEVNQKRLEATQSRPRRLALERAIERENRKVDALKAEISARQKEIEDLQSLISQGREILDPTTPATPPPVPTPNIPTPEVPSTPSQGGAESDADAQRRESERKARELERQRERKARELERQRERASRELARQQEAERTEIRKTEDARAEAIRKTIALIQDRFTRERAAANHSAQVQIAALQREIESEEISAERKKLLEQQIALLRQQEIAKLAEIDEREKEERIRRIREVEQAELNAQRAARQAREETERASQQAREQAREEMNRSAIATINAIATMQNAGRGVGLMPMDESAPATGAGLRAVLEPFASAVTALPFDFISGFRERRQAAEDLARQIREINESEVLSAREKARRIEEIERRSAEVRKGIFEDVLGSFLASMAQMVVEAGKRRVTEKLVDVGVDLLTSVLPAAAVGFLTGGPAGAAVAGGASAVRAFDDPFNDAMAREVGRRSAGNFSQIFFHDRQSAADLSQHHAAGFAQGLSGQTRPTQASTVAQPQTLNATIQVNTQIGDREILQIFRRRVKLTEQGRK